MMRQVLGQVLAACGVWMGAWVGVVVALMAWPLAAFMTVRTMPTDPQESSLYASYRHALESVRQADAACDLAWLNLDSRAAFEKMAQAQREKFAAALGGLPPKAQRCPLNARVTGVVKRNGYRIEKVLFESWPGVHVTGNLFVPENPQFKPPYPTILLPCGHTANGKGAASYQRAGVVLAQAGFVGFLFDPYEQGERLQGKTRQHQTAGAFASLLGGGFLKYYGWDCIRALDYLETRPEVDANRFGVTGNSGGGCQSAFMESLDPRIKASVPAGYICSYSREAAEAMIGTGHAEQNTFNQLALGVNHASLVLMGNTPVLVAASSHDEIFPYSGTADTMDVVRRVAARCGLADRYALVTAKGHHTWRESHIQAAKDWFRHWLCGGPLPRDFAAYAKFDERFELAKVDTGVANGGERVTPQGQVLKLPGERTIYDVFRDEYAAICRARREKPDAGTVMRVAGMREANMHLTVEDVEHFAARTSPYEVHYQRYHLPDGMTIPATELEPFHEAGAPKIFIATGKRSQRLPFAKAELKANRRCVFPDLYACGEINGLPYQHCCRNEGQINTMLGVTGRTLVGVRAEELIALARNLIARTGKKPDVWAYGWMCLAAAHARAVHPELFGSFHFEEPPKGWAESLQKTIQVPFDAVVHGALLHYDWTEL